MNANIQRQALRITLLDDCVFSQRNATVGGHRGLDRIPGQTLMGAAAAQLYREFLKRGDAAYTAFHSGKLRFLDGLPSQGNNIAHPVPIAWHQPKSGADGEPTAYNFAFGQTSFPSGVQPKQMRAGYVLPTGELTEPERTLRLKTAINPKTGHAAESQLFGYESIAEGQTFITWIEADPDAADLMAEAIDALKGEILLGRSRSAEYGRVKVELATNVQPVEHGPIEANRLTLWLLSDLALTDALGRPTATPSADALGLDGDAASIDWSKTFLRTRRYSPWNAARRGYDRERLLLSAGGVISIRLRSPATAEQIETLKTGIGLFRECGLGQLWINPPLLAHASYRIGRVEQAPAEASSDAEHPLLAWLREQTTDWKTDMDRKARELAETVKHQIRIAQKLQGISDKEFGPSKSQWGRVQEAAQNLSGQNLHTHLFKGDSAVIKPKGEGWKETTLDAEGRHQTLAEWLEAALAVKDRTDRQYAYLIRRLAHRLRAQTTRRGTTQEQSTHD